MHTQKLASHASWRSNQRFSLKAYHGCESTCHARSKKVNQFPAYWANVLGPAPPDLGTTPHSGLTNLISFFLYLLIIILIAVFILIIV